MTQYKVHLKIILFSCVVKISVNFLMSEGPPKKLACVSKREELFLGLTFLCKLSFGLSKRKLRFRTLSLVVQRSDKQPDKRLCFSW